MTIVPRALNTVIPQSALDFFAVDIVLQRILRSFFNYRNQPTCLSTIRQGIMLSSAMIDVHVIRLVGSLQL